MPLLIQALLGALIQGAGSIVGKVLISLGIGYVAYQGLDTGLGFLKSQIVANMAGLPSQAIATMSALKVGSSMSILLSAFSARFVLQGLTSGALKKMVVK